ncbi:hypothetical protein [Haloprofundus salilacus]|uniref:hypothetical protein n=1 Tax=Haloprofundus salilacus TaxID=2876190 RepID=UPI001CCF6E61|nr:hypothetical protein [Haloprofundus salilacus]
MSSETAGGGVDATSGSVDSRTTDGSATTLAVDDAVSSLELEERVHERVLEFIEEYPELADLPLSRTHGRKLRRIVTEAEWRDATVEPVEPHEDSFEVTELAERSASTWSDALSAFLTAHTRYRGLLARFSNDSGDQIEIPLTDAWGEEYSKKQYARALALQRQMAGGERPSGGKSVAAWENAATAMVTLTGSSVPDGSRLPPVDFLDSLHDSFSYNGVRDTLRNTMEYHLGLDADEWGYWLQAEPHGVGGDGGMNACYTHLHVGIYFDAGQLEIHRVEKELRRVVEKHVGVCEYANESAHRDAISVNESVENMGSYLATYMGGYTEELLEKPVEYLAWGAVYWSAARRRTSRSQLLNDAIAADACQQRAEYEGANQSDDHGDSVVWNDANGLDVVCECCGSGWMIDQTRLDEPIPDADVADAVADGGSDEANLTLSQRWPSATAAAAVGETTLRAKIRSRVESWLEHHPDEQPSVPRLLGDLSLDPVRHRAIVNDVLQGVQPKQESFRRTSLDSEWQLEAIVDRDGKEHQPGGGGIDMATLHLPVDEFADEIPVDGHTVTHWRCPKCNLYVHNKTVDQIAGHLVEGHGLRDPTENGWNSYVEPLSRGI